MSNLLQNQLKASGVAQVLVMLKTPAAAAAAEAGGTKSLASIEACFRNSELSINSALVAAGAVVAAGVRAHGTRARRNVPSPPKMLHFPNLGMVLGIVSREGLSALRDDSQVASVSAAPQLRLVRPTRIAAASAPSDITWGIKFLDIPKLWDQGLTGKGVRVGHLDTGVDDTHPALLGAVTAFAEFNDLGMPVTPNPAPRDTGQHGTHTAGTIAGRPVGGKHIGVAPKAELASAIVIEGGNVVARVLAGMDWAIGQQVRVLNISLGLPFTPPLPEFDNLLRILRARGVLPVVAVGNEGPGTSRPPGNHPESLSVGGVDENTVMYINSSSQRFVRTADPLVPDLVAPGVAVVSSGPGGIYLEMDGTSMATPHVAGLAALLMEAVPQANIAQVEQAIYDSCKVGGLPPERCNRGIPNAVRAFNALTGIALGNGGGGTPVAVPSTGGKKKKKPGKKKTGSKKGVAKASKSATKKKAGKKKTVKKAVK